MRIIYSLMFFLFFNAVIIIGQDVPKREMRAVWIASVNNIDWPSKSGLTTNEQQQELIWMLNLAKEYHLNAIVLQVRPATDAFYPSTYEPWSQWLTGKQGVAPNPYYDPLEFAVNECRKRGLDIHLWLNPYRAETDTTKLALSENHPYNRNPEWFVTYGKMRYFNPGLDETRNHVTRVVADLVRRYDIDAIHMDDYFYPYRIAGIEFPDSTAFANNPRGFEPNQKDDWRRNNVDMIIKQIHDSIKSVKPHVEFGISPFGVWRNESKDPIGSKTRAGVTNYDDLFADILKWQKEGWIDYVTPQIYWHIGMEVADYSVLADWWSHNTYGCQLYIGQAWYRIDPKSKVDSWQQSDEIIRQLVVNRKTANIAGSMYFSAKTMKNNPLGLKEKLLDGPYRFQALPPVNHRINQITPQSPVKAVITKKRKLVLLSWEKRDNNKSFVVYKIGKREVLDLQKAENILQLTGETALELEKSKKTNPNRYIYVVTALSETNLESAGIVFKRK